MSGGIQAAGMRQSFDAGRSRVKEIIADRARGEFLRKLDASQHDLTAFEMNFIESFLGDRATKDPDLDHQWFTHKRRLVVASMMQKYGEELSAISHQPSAGKLNTDSRELTAAAQPLRAEPGTCQYVKRDEGVQRECGLPAAWKGRARPFLLYCDSCGAVVSRSFEIIALDGSGRVLKPFRTSNRRDSSSL